MRTKTIRVPELSDDLALEMSRSIRPVASDGFAHKKVTIGETLCDIKRKVVTSSAHGYECELDLNEHEFVDILTYHTAPFRCFFKPTAFEVYAAINRFIPNWRDRAVYFECDVGVSGLGFEDQHHIALTRVYFK